jgi:hypothetical protein
MQVANYLSIPLINQVVVQLLVTLYNEQCFKMVKMTFQSQLTSIEIGTKHFIRDWLV